jgi:KDO2-lipid IV(A) lauroyltransferase
MYYLDPRHRAVCYANIKRALGDTHEPWQAVKVTKEFYRNFGQNMVDIFMIPRINEDYFKRYFKTTGRENIDKAFRKGKGVIFLAVHAGSWELSNVVCANLGFPFNLLVRDQRHPRMDGLLNDYRRKKGCKLITRHNQTRALIEALKNNEAIGITFDQGGKEGNLVKFFGQDASFATGAIRMALAYGAVVLPAYYTRMGGPYLETIIHPPLELKKTGDKEKDIQDNLNLLVPIFEEFIRQHPADYFWRNKIWKYGRHKRILILSDGKAGHLCQAQAVAKNIVQEYVGKGVQVEVQNEEVRFKNKFAQGVFTLNSVFSGKYSCQGSLWYLSKFLEKRSFKKLTALSPDIVISCGSSLAALNFILARQNLSKSIAVLKPSVLSTRRFGLVIMPRHDRPPKRKNVLVTEGVLNLIDQEYLSEQAEALSLLLKEDTAKKKLRIGVLLGGDTSRFVLSREVISEVIAQVKSAARHLGAEILFTTSRRTSPEVEVLVKKELKDDPLCKLLVVANEKNIPEAVGGILGLSQIIVVSPESTSMVSEAVCSRKYVVVFESDGLIRKHRKFLEYFARNNYIYSGKPEELGKIITGLWEDRPEAPVLSDGLEVAKAVQRIL